MLEIVNSLSFNKEGPPFTNYLEGFPLPKVENAKVNKVHSQMYFINLLFKYEFTYTSRARHAPFAILRDS